MKKFHRKIHPKIVVFDDYHLIENPADLSHGLSHADIAANRKLSVNTVKIVITNIYDKLGAENPADLIRIAVERKLI